MGTLTQSTAPRHPLAFGHDSVDTGLASAVRVGGWRPSEIFFRNSPPRATAYGGRCEKSPVRGYAAVDRRDLPRGSAGCAQQRGWMAPSGSFLTQRIDHAVHDAVVILVRRCSRDDFLDLFSLKRCLFDSPRRQPCRPGDQHTLLVVMRCCCASRMRARHLTRSSQVQADAGNPARKGIKRKAGRRPRRVCRIVGLGVPSSRLRFIRARRKALPLSRLSSSLRV